MKKIFIPLIILVTGTLMYCTKDTDPDQTVPATIHKVLTVEDFTPEAGVRDGKKPFDFPTSQVIFDPFTSGVPQIAFNIERMDSSVYIRQDNGGANYQGIMFGNYKITKYFKDGTSEEYKIYAPANGPKYTVLPDVLYNQVDPTNPHNSTTIVRQPKSEWYYDHRCGKMKRQYLYAVTTDTTAAVWIEGDRCWSHVFSYKLIN